MKIPKQSATVFNTALLTKVNNAFMFEGFLDENDDCDNLPYSQGLWLERTPAFCIPYSQGLWLYISTSAFGIPYSQGLWLYIKYVCFLHTL